MAGGVDVMVPQSICAANCCILCVRRVLAHF